MGSAFAKNASGSPTPPSRRSEILFFFPEALLRHGQALARICRYFKSSAILLLAGRYSTSPLPTAISREPPAQPWSALLLPFTHRHAQTHTETHTHTHAHTRTHTRCALCSWMSHISQPWAKRVPERSGSRSTAGRGACPLPAVVTRPASHPGLPCKHLHGMISSHVASK